MMSFTPMGTPCRGPRKFPPIASDSHARASLMAPAASTVTHALTCESTRSMRLRRAWTYSTGETERAGIKPATSASVRFSRLIFDMNGVLLQRKEVGGGLIDIRRQFLGSALAKLLDSVQAELRFYLFFCHAGRIVSDN